MRFEHVSEVERRVLVCAPHGRDAQLLVKMLDEHGICGQAQLQIDVLAAELRKGAAAAIITEEALHGAVGLLSEAMKDQPAWSDMPIIVLTTGGELNSRMTWDLLRKLEPFGNVSLLERPLRTMTLISAVQVALRSRARQYEVRSLYEDMEHRVQERTAELQRLNEEAEGFSYTIAHDLRTPLRGIIATSKILLMDHGPQLTEEARSLLTRQALAASRLAALIDDLLHLSRISREEMQLHDFDLSSLAEQVAYDLEKQKEGPICRFAVQPGMKAYGDPTLIRFALLNLMQNACKFSPPDSTTQVGSSGDTFYVADKGIGFSPDYASKIFQPFERLVNEEDYPGTGIGLANVKRIIERHGGAVWAESAPGEGAKFFFKLPCRESSS